jgi:ATP-dependent Clp protease ATP-binding subunit ClpA
VNRVRLTPRAERVLAAAEREASTRGQDVVGVGHRMPALCREPRGLVADVLRELGVTEPIEKRLLHALDDPSYLTAGSNEIRSSDGALLEHVVEIDGTLAAVDLDGQPLNPRS